MSLVWSWLSRLTNGNGLSNILILLLIGLWLWIGLTVRINTQVDSPTIAAMEVDIQPVLNKMRFVAVDRARYEAIIERPLFYQDRRPVETIAEMPLVLGQFELTGVVITTEHRSALLKNKKTGKELRIKQGEEINRWLVELVEAKKVTLRQGSRIEVIELKIRKSNNNKKKRQTKQRFPKRR